MNAKPCDHTIGMWHVLYEGGTLLKESRHDDADDFAPDVLIGEADASASG